MPNSRTIGLVELRVRDLGVIADLTLIFGPGMTALTGETGAGKTLLVDAIELLLGGRADSVLVRPGATEAVVEGRFETAGGEVVLARAVPAGGGRSRAYVDGRMAPVAALGEAGGALVDLHGQHAHQSLLAPAAQRAALDGFAATDLSGLAEARQRLRSIGDALDELGGDERARAREIDLLRFQLDEIEAAGIRDGAEDALLEEEEDRLADADAVRDAAGVAHDALAGDGGASDALSAALAAATPRPALETVVGRLRGLQAEVGDVVSELRGFAEGPAADPERLAAVRSRRQLLRDLQRKYGDTLDEVVAFASATACRLDDLVSHEARVAALEAEKAVVQTELARAAAKVAKTRRGAAAPLAEAIEAHLRELALPRARVEITVGGPDPADDVTFLFAANPGEPTLPLAKIASGGELARTMLAARLVLSDSPPVLVFDEVDAGIGGSAAVAVGRSLAALAAERQVLVVTHLPQVAAFADAQVAVTKDEIGGRTIASASVLDDAARVVELSRMISGQPESSTARDHAEELLATARATKR